MADSEDRRRRLDGLKVAIESSTLADAASYAAETEVWERAELTDAP